jgi:hypothetical protein
MHPPNLRQKLQGNNLPEKSIIVKQTPQNQKSVQPLSICFIVLDSGSHSDSCPESEQMREAALLLRLIKPFPGGWQAKQMGSAKFGLSSRLSSR